MNKPVRVRFAPSPTGLLHLGSVRTALFNYLFSHQNNGAFILRIEDTDAERNFDPQAKIILEDLAWLNLSFDEGPIKNGPYASYFQSERTAIYQEKLAILEKNNAIYRCFCSIEVLEKKRSRQIALKQPPRYDRACLNLSSTEITAHLQQQAPFIWRFKLPAQQTVVINDLVRGAIEFDMSNFADFALTRPDGSFTFLFANAVDDVVMKISHIFRGEDHISNTPCQAVLYQALGSDIPIFWHMPVICNNEGKKLSKRDFGFSLRDLKQGGYLPEAICNYLAIIGGSFAQEIMDLKTLIASIDFNALHSTSAIRYDVEKLTWVNHQWLMRLSDEELIARGIPFLCEQFPSANTIAPERIAALFALIKPELKTLRDVPTLLSFYFMQPAITKNTLLEHESAATVDSALQLFSTTLHLLEQPDVFYTTIAQQAKEKAVPLKSVWRLLRVLLTGQPHGPGIKELLQILGPVESKKRIEKVL